MHDRRSVTCYAFIHTAGCQRSLILFSVCYTMMFTDEFTFTSMQVVSIFYMMLRFVSSLINTHDDHDDEDWSTSTKDLPPPPGVEQNRYRQMVQPDALPVSQQTVSQH